MELEARLRAFAAFARHRSFSAAARELRISQPAVSKHIADVERNAGVRLIHRRQRNSELTAAGAFLANHVLRAQALLAQADRGVAEFRERPAGVLTIVASGVPATYLLPEVLVAFARAHPNVRVQIRVAASAQTMDALRSHRAELGVVGGFAAAPEIEAVPLVQEDIVVVGPRALAGRTISRREAEAAMWIELPEGSATRAVIEAAWADAGITPSRRLELTSWEAVKVAVARGDGLAGLSEFTIARELRDGTLGVVRLRGWKVRRTISIVHHRDAVLTPSARAFVAMLHERWGQSPRRRRRSVPRTTRSGTRRAPRRPSASSSRCRPGRA